MAATALAQHRLGDWFRPRLLGFAIGSLAVYAALTIAALHATYLPFDIPVDRFVQGLPLGSLLGVFSGLDELEGNRQFLTGIGLIVLVAIINWRRGLLMLAGSLSGQIYWETQAVVGRPRPDAALVHVIRHTGSSSFPSGHVVFFCWAAVLTATCLMPPSLPRPARIAVYTGVGALILATCLGRLWMGEHWPSDVLGGLALGLGWTALVMSIKPLSNPALERR